MYFSSIKLQKHVTVRPFFLVFKTAKLQKKNLLKLFEKQSSLKVIQHPAAHRYVHGQITLYIVHRSARKICLQYLHIMLVTHTKFQCNPCKNMEISCNSIFFFDTVQPTNHFLAPVYRPQT